MKSIRSFGLFLIAAISLASLRPSAAEVTLKRAFPSLRFSSPVDLQHAGDGSGRLFVVEQAGRIYVFDNQPDVSSRALFLDITDRVEYGGERGLLCLAFHPQYQENGFFFVNYTAPSPLHTVIARFSVDPNDPGKADPTSELILLTFNQPFQNHNGGRIAFGPDGYLYIATGDGGSGGDPQGNAQNVTRLLGKILRIDVDNPANDLPYGIPESNPFAGATDATRKEIY